MTTNTNQPRPVRPVTLIPVGADRVVTVHLLPDESGELSAYLGIADEHGTVTVQVDAMSAGKAGTALLVASGWLNDPEQAARIEGQS